MSDAATKIAYPGNAWVDAARDCDNNCTFGRPGLIFGPKEDHDCIVDCMRAKLNKPYSDLFESDAIVAKTCTTDASDPTAQTWTQFVYSLGMAAVVLGPAAIYRAYNPPPQLVDPTPPLTWW